MLVESQASVARLREEFCNYILILKEVGIVGKMRMNMLCFSDIDVMDLKLTCLILSQYILLSERNCLLYFYV